VAKEEGAWTVPTNLGEKLVDNEQSHMAKIWRHEGRNRKYSSGSSRPSS